MLSSLTARICFPSGASANVVAPSAEVSLRTSPTGEPSAGSIASCQRSACPSRSEMKTDLAAVR